MPKLYVFRQQISVDGERTATVRKLKLTNRFWQENFAQEGAKEKDVELFTSSEGMPMYGFT